MTSLVYNSFFADSFRGRLDLVDDEFRVMLVGVGYEPDKEHSRRADVSDEIAGVGYQSGGKAVDVSMELDTDRVKIGLSGASWPLSTIQARGAVYYRAGGGELIAYIDFGGDVKSASGTFALTGSQIVVHG